MNLLINNLHQFIFLVIPAFITIMPAQNNLSPKYVATAQTCGSYCRGLDAINWNPANLAYQPRKTIYSIHVFSSPSKMKSDSLAAWLWNTYFVDSLDIHVNVIESVKSMVAINQQWCIPISSLYKFFNVLIGQIDRTWYIPFFIGIGVPDIGNSNHIIFY